MTYFLSGYLSKSERGEYSRQSPNKFLGQSVKKNLGKTLLYGTNREHSETARRIFCSSHTEFNLPFKRGFQ